MGPRFNYGKGLYDQLAEVMARLDTVEKTHQEETSQMKEEISALRRENRELKEENRLLKEDNARMKSILNNDSSNTSLPPSSDQKGGRPANTYNSREKTGRRSGGQKGHKGTTLTKADVEENLQSGKYCHRIREIGKERGGDYTVKYVLDLEVVPVITEVRIYRGKEGTVAIGEEYRSDVCYGEQVKALAVMLYGEGGRKPEAVGRKRIWILPEVCPERGKGCEMPGGKAAEPGSRINGRNRSHTEWGSELYPQLQHQGYGAV